MADKVIYRGKVGFITRKDGTIHARGFYRDEFGDRKAVWRKVVATKKAAKDAVVEEIERILNPTEEKRDYTFIELAEYYKTHHAIPARFVGDIKVEGKKSYRVMRHDADVLKNHFGKTKIRNITRDKIQAFKIAHLDQKTIHGNQRSLSDVHHKLKTLRAMLYVALSNDWIDKVPNLRGVIQTSAENKRDYVPTPAEFLRVLEESEKRPKAAYIKLFVLLVADCGSRPTEVYNLRWSDVDFDANTITLTSDKGRKRTRRKVPMTTRIIDELGKMSRPNEFVFFGIKSVKKVWASVKKEAKVDFDIYNLRHLFNSRLIDLGYAYEERLLLMGQTQFDTNLIYSHILPGTLEGIAEKLNNNPYLPETDAVN